MLTVNTFMDFASSIMLRWPQEWHRKKWARKEFAFSIGTFMLATELPESFMLMIQSYTFPFTDTIKVSSSRDSLVKWSSLEKDREKVTIFSSLSMYQNRIIVQKLETMIIFSRVKQYSSLS